MSVHERHHVRVTGDPSGPPMVFAHGFGCDQAMWRFVAPEFERDHQVVLFDLVGAGHSDLSAYDPARYASLDGYADDVVQLVRELGLTDVRFVGHSVSAIIGVLAVTRAPELFSQLIMVSPSPRYANDDDYVGGMTERDIDGLLEALDSNYLGWSAQMAPVIVGRPDLPELEQELTDSFCRTDPEIARQFAEVTFRSDNRADLARVRVPSLVLQCAVDAIAPPSVGQFVHEQIPGSTLTVLDTVGHCPHLSAPDQTIDAMRAFLAAPVPG
jgi:sigma-B regulation protein RsbQ